MSVKPSEDISFNMGPVFISTVYFDVLKAFLEYNKVKGDDKMGNQNFKQTVYVNRFTDGTLDPNVEMAYHVKDKGNIISNTKTVCREYMIESVLIYGLHRT